MFLTKQQAIENHRKMWNWIADESLRQKRCVDKDEAFKHFGWEYIPKQCWCCEYASAKINCAYFNKCTYCPLIWGNDISKSCTFSEFFKWQYAFDIDDLETAVEYARKIAELPERE